PNAGAARVAELATPLVEYGLRQTFFAPEDVIGGVELAVAVNIAGARAATADILVVQAGPICGDKRIGWTGDAIGINFEITRAVVAELDLAGGGVDIEAEGRGRPGAKYGRDAVVCESGVVDRGHLSLRKQRVDDRKVVHRALEIKTGG